MYCIAAQVPAIRAPGLSPQVSKKLPSQTDNSLALNLPVMDSRTLHLVDIFVRTLFDNNEKVDSPAQSGYTKYWYSLSSADRYMIIDEPCGL
jgi:hypothetical protein